MDCVRAKSGGVEMIEIKRIWAMPNKWTFKIKPIAKLLEEELTTDLWIDPFAGMYSPAKITNDLNIDMPTDYHIDALDFLKMFEDASVFGVLLDPPYSVRQVAECYKGIGKNVTNEDTGMQFYSNIKDEVTRITTPLGKVITCGWNSMGCGKNRGFSIKRILLVPHGGHKNDTIVVVEQKKQTTLKEVLLK